MISLVVLETKCSAEFCINVWWEVSDPWYGVLSGLIKFSAVVDCLKVPDSKVHW